MKTPHLSKPGPGAPPRWPLASVFIAVLLAGLSGCYYYYPEGSGHGYVPSSHYGQSRCSRCGGYHPPGHCRYGHPPGHYKHAKHKYPKYKHKKYKHKKHKHY